MREEGRTVLFSTHGMHEAEQLCDFIVLINQGKVVVDGTLDEIRAGHESHTVSIEMEGDAAFVRDAAHGGGGQGRRPADGRDACGTAPIPQDLLRTLVERARVRAFEIKQPSLHEIFVRLVGGGHVEDL